MMLMNKMSRFSALLNRNSLLRMQVTRSFAGKRQDEDLDFEDEEAGEVEQENPRARGKRGNQRFQGFKPIFTTPEERHSAMQALLKSDSVKTADPALSLGSSDNARNLFGEVLEQLNDRDANVFQNYSPEQQTILAQNIFELAKLASENTDENAPQMKVSNILAIFFYRLRNRNASMALIEKLLQLDIKDPEDRVNVFGAAVRTAVRNRNIPRNLRSVLQEKLESLFNEVAQDAIKNEEISSPLKNLISAATTLAHRNIYPSNPAMLFDLFERNFEENESTLLQLLSFYIKTGRSGRENYQVSNAANKDFMRTTTEEFFPADEAADSDETTTYRRKRKANEDPLVDLGAAIALREIEKKGRNHTPLADLLTSINTRNIGSTEWKARVLKAASELVQGSNSKLNPNFLSAVLGCADAVQTKPQSVEHLLSIYEHLLNSHELTDNLNYDILLPLVRSLTNFENVFNPARNDTDRRQRRRISRELEPEEIELLRRTSEMVSSRIISRYNALSIDVLSEALYESIYKLRSIQASQVESTGIREHYMTAVRKIGNNLRPHIIQNFISVENMLLRRGSTDAESWKALLDSLYNSTERFNRNNMSRLSRVAESLNTSLEKVQNTDTTELRQVIDDFAGKVGSQ